MFNKKISSREDKKPLKFIEELENLYKWLNSKKLGKGVKN